jgi:hypothetical protein
VVKSAATEAVARSIVNQVEQWVDVGERGCRLVSSIDDAHVLLELHGYRPTTRGTALRAKSGGSSHGGSPSLFVTERRIASHT